MARPAKLNDRRTSDVTDRERTTSGARTARAMFDLAAYAGELYEKAALWDKVKASVLLAPSGKWELTANDPHGDPAVAAAFERWVKGG